MKSKNIAIFLKKHIVEAMSSEHLFIIGQIKLPELLPDARNEIPDTRYFRKCTVGFSTNKWVFGIFANNYKTNNPITIKIHIIVNNDLLFELRNKIVVYLLFTYKQNFENLISPSI